VRIKADLHFSALNQNFTGLRIRGSYECLQALVQAVVEISG
jgi:hypothetical protein